MALVVGHGLPDESELNAKQPDATPATSENVEALQGATLNPISALIRVPVPENWNYAWSVGVSSHLCHGNGLLDDHRPSTLARRR